MSVALANGKLYLGPDSNGLRMAPDQFDAVRDYDENFLYELVDGVVVVNPIPLAEETSPNELLGHFLWQYQQYDDRGSALDETLPQQYVRTSRARRLADRLIWTGLGRIPDVRKDRASIAVEFVSAGRRNQQRDYVDKRRDYEKAGIQEYWIIDRFRRILTVIRYRRSGSKRLVFGENQTYESPLLPGFVLPLARLLQAADQHARAAKKQK
ncbi:MAG TPA: Uma2 family endonuclease [Gemmataceae bacterium]|nr:Uma2 family endonuclease [Gemmataceae bacterium]